MFEGQTSLGKETLIRGAPLLVRRGLAPGSALLDAASSSRLRLSPAEEPGRCWASLQQQYSKSQMGFTDRQVSSRDRLGIVWWHKAHSAIRSVSREPGLIVQSTPRAMGKQRKPTTSLSTSWSRGLSRQKAGTRGKFETNVAVTLLVKDHQSQRLLLALLVRRRKDGMKWRSFHAK